MSANPTITPGLANRVADFPRLCHSAPCLVRYNQNGQMVQRLARYKDVAWMVFEARPMVIGHTVLVGGVSVLVEIGNTIPLHEKCPQCGNECL